MTASACVWLCLFPLLQGGTYAHITRDKWMIALVLTGVTFLCFLFDMIFRYLVRKKASGSGKSGTDRSPHCVIPNERKKSARRVVPLILISAILLWNVLSCVFSSFGPEVFWVGEATRYEGLLIELCYGVLFVLFFFSRVNLKPVLLSAAAGVAAFFAVVLLQRASGNPLGLYPGGRGYLTNPEFQGTIGNIDMCTGYLLLLAGLFLYGLLRPVPERRESREPSGGFRALVRSRTHWDRFCLSVYLLALLLTVWLIWSMGVQFGMIGLAVLALFTFLRFLPRRWRLPLLILLIVLALLVVWFWPKYGGGIWELHEILHGRGRLSFGSNRVAVWLFSLRLARENLLFGGGSGTFRARFNRFLADNSLTIPTEQDGVALPSYFDNPHNEYIARLTDHGLPSVLFFLALLFAAFFRRRDGWFPLLAPCSAAVLCYAVQAFFSFSVPLVAPMFWVILGLSFRE